MTVKHHDDSKTGAKRIWPALLRGSRKSISAALVLLIAPTTLLATPPAKAARDTDLTETANIIGGQTAENLQLVVLEAPGCTYCNLFRKYVVAAYETSPKSRSLPLKFIDLNDEAYAELGLDGPVDMVPTTVLLQNNREIGRIPGYVGPENFFHAVNHLMGRVN